jgi:hypothetical protein
MERSRYARLVETHLVLLGATPARGGRAPGAARCAVSRAFPLAQPRAWHAAVDAWRPAGARAASRRPARWGALRRQRAGQALLAR